MSSADPDGDRQFLREAVKRAKEIYAEIHPGMKRYVDEGSSEVPDVPEKKLDVEVKPQPDSDAAITTEAIDVPEAIAVSMMEDRNGAQISQIKGETKCEIVIGPFSKDNHMRCCSITGNASGIVNAKEMIRNIIDKWKSVPQQSRSIKGGDSDGSEDVKPSSVMRIPNARCGLIIGRRGETIRQIQGQSGANLKLMDECDSDGMKSLHIVGNARSVRMAREMVEEVLASSRDRGPRPLVDCYFEGGPGPGGYNNHGFFEGPWGRPNRDADFRNHHRRPEPRRFDTNLEQIFVPADCVGAIMGKSGASIKRLIAESGANISFNSNDAKMTVRCVDLVGSHEQITKAAKMIWSIVEGHRTETVLVDVPANKAGIVIGRGGECIKQICSESGAHVELRRDETPNEPQNVVFSIKGTTFQIRYAQHLIRMKTGEVMQGNAFSEFPTPSDGTGASNTPNTYVPNGCVQSAPLAPLNNNFVPNPMGGPYVPPEQPQMGFSQTIPPNSVQNPMPTPSPQPTPSPVFTFAPPPNGQPDYVKQWVEYYRSLGMNDYANAFESYYANAITPGTPVAPNYAQPQQPVYTTYYPEMQVGGQGGQEVSSLSQTVYPVLYPEQNSHPTGLAGGSQNNAPSF